MVHADSDLDIDIEKVYITLGFYNHLHHRSIRIQNVGYHVLGLGGEHEGDPWNGPVDGTAFGRSPEKEGNCLWPLFFATVVRGRRLHPTKSGYPTTVTPESPWFRT